MMMSLSNAKFLPAPFQRFNKMNTNFESLYDAEELKIFRPVRKQFEFSLIVEPACGARR
jgi:hypothetical protein